MTESEVLIEEVSVDELAVDEVVAEDIVADEAAPPVAPQRIGSPLQTIHKYCIDNCYIGQARSVRMCPSQNCALWPYRSGRRPKSIPELTSVGAIRARCLDCSETANDVRECWNTECELYPYRMGRNPNRTGIGGDGEALRRWRAEQEDQDSRRDSSTDVEAGGELPHNDEADE